jgi:hypothetical protein
MKVARSSYAHDSGPRRPAPRGCDTSRRALSRSSASSSASNQVVRLRGALGLSRKEAAGFCRAFSPPLADGSPEQSAQDIQMVASGPRSEHATAPVWLRLQPSRVPADICHTDCREVPRLWLWFRVFLRCPLVAREVGNGSSEIDSSALQPCGGVSPGLGFRLQMVLDVLGQVCLGIEPEEHPVAALLLQRGYARRSAYARSSLP